MQLSLSYFYLRGRRKRPRDWLRHLSIINHKTWLLHQSQGGKRTGQIITNMSSGGWLTRLSLFLPAVSILVMILLSRWQRAEAIERLIQRGCDDDIPPPLQLSLSLSLSLSFSFSFFLAAIWVWANLGRAHTGSLEWALCHPKDLGKTIPGIPYRWPGSDLEVNGCNDEERTQKYILKSEFCFIWDISIFGSWKCFFYTFLSHGDDFDDDIMCTDPFYL